ncbi:hypothetical protein [Roseovarius sp. 2305UL8-3]|uniref:hypothetical protein n=1 Tax=Roseovarius conchicola TaxID=3121636 RepID=UPI0035288AAD
MTEETGIVKIGNLNIAAFTGALLLAPLAAALPIFWIYLIPVVAVPMGYLPYLVFGGPVLFLYLLVFPANAILTGLLLLCVNIIAFHPSLDIARQIGMNLTTQQVELNLSMGSIFAPLWGAAFGVLYWIFDR